MNYISKTLLIYLVFLCTSCATDDVSDSGVEEEIGTVDVQLSDFTVIGVDENTVYQYDYDASENLGKRLSLTQELGVPNPYIKFRANKDLYSFYTFSSGIFSLYQKNTANGEIKVTPNVYNLAQEGSVVWGIDNSSTVFLGLFLPAGSTNFVLRSTNLTSGEQEDLFLDNSVESVFEPLLYEEKLFITFKDDLDNYSVAIVDTDLNTIQEILNFGVLAPHVAIDNRGDLAILSNSSGGSYTYETYDFNTLERIQQTTSTLRQFFAPGALDGIFLDEVFYFSRTYAQPSPITFGPALFDFTANTETILDVISVLENIEQTIGDAVVIVSQGFDPLSNVF